MPLRYLFYLPIFLIPASTHRASGSFIEGFMNRVGRGLRSRRSSWLRDVGTGEVTFQFLYCAGCGCRGFLVYISTQYLPTFLYLPRQESGVLLKVSGVPWLFLYGVNHFFSRYHLSITLNIGTFYMLPKLRSRELNLRPPVIAGGCSESQKRVFLKFRRE